MRELLNDLGRQAVVLEQGIWDAWNDGGPPPTQPATNTTFPDTDERLLQEWESNLNFDKNLIGPTRHCDCGHGFPVCACFEGLVGEALLARSRWLSSVAGWPMRVDPAEATRVIAEYGRPCEPVVPPALIVPRATIATSEEAGDCGCGQGRA